MGKASKRKKLKRTAGTQSMEKMLASLGKFVDHTKEVIVRTDLPEEEKISRALVTLLEPLVSEDSAFEAYQTALGAVVTAWNISLLPLAEQPKAMEQVAATLSGGNAEIHEVILLDLRQLIAEKQRLFPRDRRVVVQWEGKFVGKEFRVTAAALSQAT
jgi:hypothetical protein